MRALRPQAQSVPSALTASQMLNPTATSIQLVSAVMRVGTSKFCGLLGAVFPNLGLPPQIQRLPSDWMPAALTRPARIFTQFVAVPTCTGLGLSVHEPIPSWLKSLSPQAHSEPSRFSP